MIDVFWRDGDNIINYTFDADFAFINDDRVLMLFKIDEADEDASVLVAEFTDYVGWAYSTQEEENGVQE